MDLRWALFHPREASAIVVCRALGLVETGDISVVSPSICAYATTALSKYRLIMQKSDETVPACMRAGTTWTFLAKLVDRWADDALRVDSLSILEATLCLVLTESLPVVDDAKLAEEWEKVLEKEKEEMIYAAEAEKKAVGRKACAEAANVLAAIAECGPEAVGLLKAAVILVESTP